MASAPARPRTDLDLEKFRRMLNEERDRLRDDIREVDEAEHSAEAGEAQELSHYDQHMADQGTELFLREQSEAVHVGLQAQLDGVEAALTKMEAGTYGICDRCSAEIPEERLEFLPASLYCIRCADEMEGRF